MDLKTLRRYSFLFVFLPITIFSQSSLTINEISPGGKGYDVAPIIENGKVKSYPNIDINSAINIKIDKAKIKDEAAKYIGKTQELPFVRMKIVSDALLLRKKLIEEINLDDKSSLEVRKKALADVANNTLPLLIFINNLPSNSILRIKAENIFSKSNKTAAETYNDFFDLLQKEIDDINVEYVKAVEDNKVYFRLGAFVNNTPVHLDGFDVIKEKEYYKVPRFITSIPDSEKTVFNNYKKIADDANKNAGVAFKNKLKEAIQPILKKIKDTVEQIISKPVSD